MKKHSSNPHRVPPEDSLERYDWNQATRGRYAARFPQHTHAVVIDPKPWSHFGSADAVNEGLRTLVKMAALATKRKFTDKPRGRRAA